MGATLFRGPTQLRQWIADYLEATIPPMVAQALGDWSLLPEQLPVPQKYDAYDLSLIGTNGYPAVGADFPNETNDVRTDFTDRAEQEYLSNYAGSVFVWVATPRTADDKLEMEPRITCMRVRDDLTELVKQALLLRPSLNQPPGTCWLEETAVNVNKTDPWKAGENRPDYTAGASISVVYRVRSELCLAPLGVAEDFDLDVQKGWEFP